MIRKVPKALLIILILTGIGLTGYFIYIFFGPGWQWVTPTASEFDFKLHSPESFDLSSLKSNSLA
ncbi:MAG: hypothetical protein ACKO1U_10735, partial [Bacteroidota bacterium]